MDGIGEKIFVFVVCGAKVHTDTLNFSLPFLQKRTQYRIIVVTDLSRNEGKISHPDFMDIKTPEAYSHHQACIYLKTGLHRFLPQGNAYCYLDSDVLSTGENVDQVFDEFIPPIRFAADRAPLNYFSPYAVNCGCKEDFDARPQAKADRKEWYWKTMAEIDETVEKTKHRWFYFIKKWQYDLSTQYYRLNRKYYLDKQTDIWYLRDGTKMILDDFPEMQDFEYECSHLARLLNTEFNIQVPNDWNHWNGGVFLFNDGSATFMDEWHRISISFFGNKKWKTRDQASLVAVAWKMGLQNHPVMDSKWNFLIDYDKGEILQSGDDVTLLYKGVPLELPEFSHIYSHFGDETWDVWNFLIQKG